MAKTERLVIRNRHRAPLPRRPERRLGLGEAIGHAAIGAVGRHAGRAVAAAGTLAAAPVAQQTGEGGQCLLTDTNSCL